MKAKADLEAKARAEEKEAKAKEAGEAEEAADDAGASLPPVVTVDVDQKVDEAGAQAEGEPAEQQQDEPAE